MMKPNIDFSQPMRQSAFAILMILWKTIRMIFAQLLPIVLVFLFGDSLKRPLFLLVSLITIVILAMIISIIKYYKTYFYISENELVVHKGVFNKVKTTIPFDKIQSIAFNQNVIQQIFEVTQLNIETAGSDKTELVFHAINNEKAQALRDYIFTHKKETPTITSTATTIAKTNLISSYQSIISLDIVRLLKVGLTENHIKSFWIIIIFFYWILDNLQEAGMDLEGFSEEVETFNWSTNILFTLTIFFVLVALIISLSRVVFSYFDLQFMRNQNGFKIIRGLFNRKEVSVPYQKIQIISWGDNLLKKLVGFKDLYLSQASSSQLSTKQLIKIPGCSDAHVREVIQTVMGEMKPEDIQLESIDFKYFARFSIIIAVVAGILTILLFLANKLLTIPILWLFVVYFMFVRYLAYSKKRYGFNEKTLYIQGGKWGHNANLLEIYKIQSIQIKASPFQRRHQLCTLKLYTASGNVSIPYIPLTIGKSMVDYFIYITETSNKSWM